MTKQTQDTLSEERAMFAKQEVARLCKRLDDILANAVKRNANIRNSRSRK